MEWPVRGDGGVRSRVVGLVASAVITWSVALLVHGRSADRWQVLTPEAVGALLGLAGRLDVADAAEAACLSRRLLELDPNVRVESVGDCLLSAVDRMPPEDGLIVLDRLARQASSSGVRARAMEALAVRSRLGWLASLATSEADPRLRELAVRRVTEGGRAIDPNLVGHLVEASYDVSGEVRLWACRALGAAGPSCACDRALLDHLEDPVRAVSIAATGAIQRRRSSATLDPVLSERIEGWLRLRPERARAGTEEPRHEPGRRRRPREEMGRPAAGAP